MMARTSSHHEDTTAGRVLTAFVNRPGRVVLALGLLTALFVVAGIATTPGTEASFSPGGKVFATAELVERTFRPSTTELQFIVEDEDADALDLATLREWKQNTDELRSSDELSPALSTYYDNDLGRNVAGFYTIADAVDDELRATGVAAGLAGATEDEAKTALGNVLDEQRPTVLFRDLLSVRATSDRRQVGGKEIALWTSPAFLAAVRVDHAAFPVDLESKSDPASRTNAQQDAIDAARDVEIERWGRDALSTLRGDRQELDAWGIGIDNTLTSDESFTATIPYLLAAFALIVLLVGGVFRSYWASALAGAGIAVTLLWSRMITNIIGFDESIILDVIVPIATISFGVDFLIHAVGRVREELTSGAGHRSAYVVGIANVAGALGLALSTSAIALASNATSSIQAVTEFGFGAAIALASAFVVLGILAPLFLLRIEEIGGDRAPGVAQGVVRRTLGWLRLVAAAAFASLVIIAVIAVPFVGFVATLVYTLLFVGVPAWLLRRRSRKAVGAAPAAVPNTAGDSSALAGRIISGIVRLRYPMFAVVALVTIAAGIGATHVGRQTEPRDFFPSGSDFITGIDKLVAHTSTASPGDVYVYVEGEIADPEVLAAAKAANEDVSRNGGDLFARNPDGTLSARDSAIDVARAGVGIAFARTSVEDATGVALTDANGDGLPDTADQVQALFSYATENGVPSDASTFVYTKDQVARLLQPVAGGGFATVLRYPLQGFPDTSKVKDARRLVESSTLALTEAATGSGRSVEARVSGDIVAEQVTLDAVTNAMVISVPLAMLLCFAVAALAMRSVRLAAVSVVPIALVIVWLLAFMAAFDYNINVITATIAAISVGVGIDFSTHYTMRYREQLGSGPARLEAVRIAAEGTGTALILSGITSIIGFGVLALAPMPIFAAYGLLTAVMIALSLAATLVVLPSLLFVLGPRSAPERSAEPAHAAEPAPSEQPT
jgi:predicted RND superfamily exporter protein